MKVRIWVAIAVSATCLGSCSAVDLVKAKVAEVSGASCVDADGPNSSLDQIVDAMMTAKFVDPHTGQQTTMAEQTRSSLEAVQKYLPAAENIDTSDAGIRAKLSEQIYTDVPAGGDAAFAHAVCNLTDAWTRVNPFLSDHDAAAKAPHLLRASGRMLCGRIKGTAEEATASIDKPLATAKQNPDHYLAKIISDQEAKLADLKKSGADSPLTSDLIRSQEATLNKLRRTNPDDVVKGLQMWHDFVWAAVENQCPSLSAVGFGEKCGTVSSQSGETTFLVKLKRQPVSCDEAMSVMRSFQTSGSSGDRNWYCTYPSRENPDWPVRISCQRSDNGGSAVAVNHS
ncbi:hypothetical protein [Smaragdicoccus niigatensis]|uniref:hypothetical protein n=1 Tax=Smaragdicoccus niigatensis TaxID=359359 RepID=UPI00037E43BD|nr:hypothetical protein [Smaragdicoccus niigatensis]